MRSTGLAIGLHCTEPFIFFLFWSRDLHVRLFSVDDCFCNDFIIQSEWQLPRAVSNSSIIHKNKWCQSLENARLDLVSWTHAHYLREEGQVIYLALSFQFFQKNIWEWIIEVFQHQNPVTLLWFWKFSFWV